MQRPVLPRLVALRLLVRLFAALFCIAWAMSRGAAAAEQPNIVLIMTDDQGYGDLGVHGNPVIETPNIDAMARRSARLENFYVCPVCTPTRACLMTGRYQYRTRAFDTYVGRAMMEPDEVTVAELLARGGYGTGIFGKWHLGDNYPLRPQDQGFDEVLVHRGGGIGQPSDPPGGEGKYTSPILLHNGEKKQFEGYCTDIYFDHAIEWMKKQHEAQRPFFAYVPTNAPHAPYHDVPQELYEKYKAKDLTPVLLGNEEQADRVARIYAMIENIDENVGKLFEALDALEVTDETIVIFMCDNGPNTRRYVGNMRGMKGEVLEGGIRSPFFMQWPARLSAGMKSHEPAAHIDVLPTLLAAANVTPPPELKLDGRNILPLLEEEEVDWPQRPLVLQWHRGDTPQRFRHFALRRGDWKLLNKKGRAEPWQEGEETGSLVDAGFELYNLADDPREQNNLVDEQPQIAAELKAAYEDWFRDVSTTREDNFAPPRMIIGSREQPVVVLTRQDWRRTRGGGWGSGGKWLLDVQGDRAFDVTVRLGDPFEAKSGTVELTAGDVQRETEISSGDTTAKFGGVPLPAGPLALSAEVKSGETTGPPHQVVIERKRDE